ncbi:MAG: hypothetical protein KF744_15845 [Taibaiella sp.]|nr:hypothetical protein [Taibaiella sp.]
MITRVNTPDTLLMMHDGSELSQIERRLYLGAGSVFSKYFWSHGNIDSANSWSTFSTYKSSFDYKYDTTRPWQMGEFFSIEYFMNYGKTPTRTKNIFAEQIDDVSPIKCYYQFDVTNRITQMTVLSSLNFRDTMVYNYTY